MSTGDLLFRDEQRPSSPPRARSTLSPAAGPHTPPQKVSLPAHGRQGPRRSLSCAESSLKSRQWFSTPDRFLTPRTDTQYQQNVFHVGRSPTHLSSREQSFRRRDATFDPFHCHRPSKSKGAVRTRNATPLVTHHPPHFTPSFVYGQDASPGPIDVNGELPEPQRRVSVGAVWNVGGAHAAHGGPRAGVINGHGGFLASGTHGPMHTALFLDTKSGSQETEQHEDRLALALGIDQAHRVLNVAPGGANLSHWLRPEMMTNPFGWRNNAWTRDEGLDPSRTQLPKASSPSVPAIPFRVLDAPRLRDDFYCSTLAYSHAAKTLAVGLSSRVYLWSEEAGVRFPPIVSTQPANYVTSLSFSSEPGGKAILAVGRQTGQISLISPLDEGRPRCQVHKSKPVSCLAFKPCFSVRPSRFAPSITVQCEDLLVGDDAGDLHYYSIEWPSHSSQGGDHAHIVQLAKVAAHSQQICGLAWSPDGSHFATGGNDNQALFFKVVNILRPEHPRGRSVHRTPTRRSGRTPMSPLGRFPPTRLPVTPPGSPRMPNPANYTPSGMRRRSSTPSLHSSQATVEPTARTPSAPLLPPSMANQPLTPPASPVRHDETLQQLSVRRHISPPQRHNTPSFIQTDHYMTPRPPQNHGPGLETYSFPHSAAVKAMAFAPWQPNLLATGGGSNDRQIHFFHTGSGATLALINVFAQVTSLIWSRTKRELCATFGYAQPEHGVRIAVFAWPSGECVVSIPWGGNGPGSGLGRSVDGGRALWAIAFPGGPNDEVASRMRARSRPGFSDAEREREGQRWGSRTQQEGCIVVAGSDESVKFHEIWTGDAKRGGLGVLGSARGVLGGSPILEAGVLGGGDELAGRAGQDVIR